MPVLAQTLGFVVLNALSRFDPLQNAVFLVTQFAPDGFHWCDANTTYDLDTALDMAPVLADSGLKGLESPLPPNRFRDYQALKEQGALPILMDEGIVSPVEVDEFIALDMFDGIAMKIARCGGLWNATPAYHWQLDPPGTAASYVSAPLAANTVVIGGGSVQLWIKASAPSVDLQATISEVRPDGKETFVQDGWVRASERKLNAARFVVTCTDANVAHLKRIAPRARIHLVYHGLSADFTTLLGVFKRRR